MVTGASITLVGGFVSADPTVVGDFETGVLFSVLLAGLAYNEPPQLPDQFVRDPNPLPPVTEPREVPLPPWIPDGPHRKS